METENPYAVQYDGSGAQRGNPGRPRLSLAILRQIRVIAILLIIHGLMLMAMGIFLVGLAIVFPTIMAAQPGGMPQQPGGPTPGQLKIMMLALYGSMGVAAIVPGILQIVAGSFNVVMKKRMLGIVALAVGTISVGTCYCTPTAIALLVYGLIIYLHDTTQQAFALHDQGYTWDEIESLARQS